jgi:hypothetical protein
MGIRKALPNPWRYDPAKPWVWCCRSCRLEATYPAATLPEAYADALEHLEDEHVAVASEAYAAAMKHFENEHGGLDAAR